MDTKERTPVKTPRLTESQKRRLNESRDERRVAQAEVDAAFERQKRIVKSIYGDGDHATMEEIAAEVDLTKARVAQIVHE